MHIKTLQVFHFFSFVRPSVPVFLTCNLLIPTKSARNTHMPLACMAHYQSAKTQKIKKDVIDPKGQTLIIEGHPLHE